MVAVNTLLLRLLINLFFPFYPSFRGEKGGTASANDSITKGPLAGRRPAWSSFFLPHSPPSPDPVLRYSTTVVEGESAISDRMMASWAWSCFLSQKPRSTPLRGWQSNSPGGTASNRKGTHDDNCAYCSLISEKISQAGKNVWERGWRPRR